MRLGLPGRLVLPARLARLGLRGPGLRGDPLPVQVTANSYFAEACPFVLLRFLEWSTANPFFFSYTEALLLRVSPYRLLPRTGPVTLCVLLRLTLEADRPIGFALDVFPFSVALSRVSIAFRLRGYGASVPIFGESACAFSKMSS